jgi:uncharacterized membrane protein YkgB
MIRSKPFQADSENHIDYKLMALVRVLLLLLMVVVLLLLLQEQVRIVGCIGTVAVVVVVVVGMVVGVVSPEAMFVVGTAGGFVLSIVVGVVVGIAVAACRPHTVVGHPHMQE